MLLWGLFPYGSTPPCWGIAAVMGRDPEQSHTAQHKCAAQTPNKMLTLNSSSLTEPAMWHWPSGRKFTQSKKHPIKTTQTISPALSLCKSVVCSVRNVGTCLTDRRKMYSCYCSTYTATSFYQFLYFVSTFSENPQHGLILALWHDTDLEEIAYYPLH